VSNLGLDVEPQEFKRRVVQRQALEVRRH
jgi:hypothetical protein